MTQRHKEPDVLRWALSLYPDGEVPVYFCTGWNGHEQLFAARPKITETIQQIKTLEARGGPLLVNAEHIDGDGNFVATLEFVSCPRCASPLVIATEPGTPRGWFRIPCPARQADLHREASGELTDVFADPRPASIE